MARVPSPAPGWRPDKGMKGPGVYVRPVQSLSQAQCDKLAELSAPLGPTGRLMVQQTKTLSGGTHLYVRVGDDEWHVGRDGNAIKMGPKDRNSLEKSNVQAHGSGGSAGAGGHLADGGAMGSSPVSGQGMGGALGGGGRL